MKNTNKDDSKAADDMMNTPSSTSKSTPADGQRMHDEQQKSRDNSTSIKTSTADAPSSSSSSSTTQHNIVDSTQTHIVNAESQLTGTAAAATIAPQPPQWRFVSRAKKTEGYSSVYAGLPVRGEYVYIKYYV